MKIIWIILGVLAGVAIILALGFAGIVPFNGITNSISGWFSNFNLSEVASNPAAVVTTVGTAASVGGLALTQINKAKQQAQTTAATAKKEINNLTGSLNESKTELETTTLNLENAEAKIAGMQTSVSTAQDQVAKLQAEKQNLLTQLEALNNIQAKAAVLAEGKAVTVTKVI